MPTPGSKRSPEAEIVRMEVDQTRRSPGYTLVAEHLHRVLAGLRTQLEGDLDLAATQRLRGHIAGIRQALAAPAYVMKHAPEEPDDAR